MSRVIIELKHTRVRTHINCNFSYNVFTLFFWEKQNSSAGTDLPPIDHVTLHSNTHVIPKCCPAHPLSSVIINNFRLCNKFLLTFYFHDQRFVNVRKNIRTPLWNVTVSYCYNSTINFHCPIILALTKQHYHFKLFFLIFRRIFLRFIYVNPTLILKLTSLNINNTLRTNRLIYYWLK